MISESLSFIKQNKSIQEFNTFGVDSVARFYARIEKKEDLFDLLNNVSWSDDRILTLGGGSNMLFVGDYDGIIVHNALKGIEVIKENNKQVRVRVGAGNNWHRFVTYCVNQGWGGVENLALIPGTVGAAPIQNIGAYGVELEEVFHSLRAINVREQTIEIFDKEDCRFGYRDSIFKKKYKEQYVITDVTLNLRKSSHTETSYRSLSEYLHNNGIPDPGIREVFEAVVAIRRNKLPNPSELGNAGSFFKNPIVSREKYDKLKGLNGEIPGYPVTEGQMKIPAAWLIDQAGWRGARRGNVGTYPNQALVIVNYGGASGMEVLNFAADIRASVYDQFDVKLKPEVNIITSGDSDWKNILIDQ